MSGPEPQPCLPEQADPDEVDDEAAEGDGVLGQEDFDPDHPEGPDVVVDGDVLDDLDDLIGQILEALQFVQVGDDDSTDYLYVQSVVIANDGRAVFRLRWNHETYRYEPSPLIESDGRE